MYRIWEDEDILEVEVVVEWSGGLREVVGVACELVCLFVCCLDEKKREERESVRGPFMVPVGCPLL